MYRFVALCIALALPMGLSAADLMKWDFRSARIPVDIELKGMEAVPRQEGIFLHAQERQALARIRVDKSKLPDAVVLTVRSQEEIPLTLHIGTHALTVHTQGGMKREEIPVPLYRLNEESLEAIAIEPPQGAVLLLEEMSFGSWSLLEKIRTAFKSFWKTDSLHVHSINFLWGPRITLLPPEASVLFASDSPKGDSALKMIIVFFGGIVLLSLIFRWRKAVMLVCCAFVWVMLDIRMSMEWLRSTMVQDYDALYELIAQSAPHLKEVQRYAFLAPNHSYDLPLRYHTYPAEPLLAEDPLITRSRIWLVFNRSDISVNAYGQLAKGDQVILPKPGRVLARTGKHSFVFEVP